MDVDSSRSEGKLDPNSLFIGTLKSTLEGMDDSEWNDLAERLRGDPSFQIQSPEKLFVMSDNLPIVLAALLPGLKVEQGQTLNLMKALIRDKSIGQAEMRPFGALLEGNFTRMKELLAARNK
jgi:hypothetical protein